MSPALPGRQSSSAPAEVAARAGNSARILHEVYLHCIDSQEDLVSQQIEDALDADTSSRWSSQCVKASGSAHRRLRPGPCPLFVREPVPGPAHCPRTSGPADPHHQVQTPALIRVSAAQGASESIPADVSGRRIRPTHSPRDTADGLLNRSLWTQKPVTQSSVTGSDLRERVAGVGFEPT